MCAATSTAASPDAQPEAHQVQASAPSGPGRGLGDAPGPRRWWRWVALRDDAGKAVSRQQVGHENTSKTLVLKCCLAR